MQRAWHVRAASCLRTPQFICVKAARAQQQEAGERRASRITYHMVGLGLFTFSAVSLKNVRMEK